MLVQPTVRRATAADASAILNVLSRSLTDDPFVRWLTGARPRAMERYFELMLCRIALPKGAVYVAGEGERLESVALWAPPSTFELTPKESLRLLPTMLAVIGPLRFTGVTSVLEEIARARPPQPHWLLTLLGTLPERRRRGLASAVMAPALARCELDGVTAVCETSDPKNLPFYAGHGFRITAERPLGESGVTSYTLQREPRARRARL